jgi:hypothetical protein
MLIFLSRLLKAAYRKKYTNSYLMEVQLITYCIGSFKTFSFGTMSRWETRFSFGSGNIFCSSSPRLIDEDVVVGA